MSKQNHTIINFSDVQFEHGFNKEILDEVSFSVRKGMKIAVMGQNGAGKSTLFKLITGDLKPKTGTISVNKDLTVSTAHQVITPEERQLTVEEFFGKVYEGESYELKNWKQMKHSQSRLSQVDAFGVWKDHLKAWME